MHFNFLSTDKNPDRLGNQHPNIVPYQVMPTSDGYIVLSIGNDPTFERFCKLAGEEKLIEDPKFKTNADRVSNREFVTNTLNEITKKHNSDWWLTELELKIVDQCLQLHGGYGYIKEYPIAKAYLNSRVQTIYGGTTEIMKEIIGKSLGF